MIIILHKRFKKDYLRLKAGEREKFKERRDLFMKDPFDATLHNHPLQGNYKGYRSISITGDLRVIYCLLGKETAHFIAMDTHAKLYSL